jgi:hypothetical protein
VATGNIQLNFATVKGGAFDRDLQIARRLDWRYLLPDPRLRDVTLIGRPDGILLEALQAFSEKLNVVASSSRTTPIVLHTSEVVVLRSSDLAAIPLARMALRSSGYLYWELEANRQRVSLPSCLAALRTHGFDEIATYWCRPNFEECLEIIPFREPSALAFVLSRHFSGTRQWLIRLFVRLVAGSEIPARLISCWSIVARKTAQ